MADFKNKIQNNYGNLEKKYYSKDKLHVLSLKKNIRKGVIEEFYIVLKFRLWQNGGL